MDVELYVYDLSRGMAREMSMVFLGTQIDAVYHTSLVFGNVEYFYGQGIQVCYPASTHHGRPMQIIKLGQTELDAETIAEYRGSLELIYTAESYDLFLHNCNNFSNDFATFLVGKGIPSYITNLPQTVMNTPFGRMLKPQLDNAMRGIVQRTVPASNVPSQTLHHKTASQVPETLQSQGKVHDVVRLEDLERLLHGAKSSRAIIFFTSSTCATSKTLYQRFDKLALEHLGQATFIKVDVDLAADIAQKYQISATPKFTTFMFGRQYEQWSDANPSDLEASIRRLVLKTQYPQQYRGHLRSQYMLRTRGKPLTYAVVPSLEKMLTKLGEIGQSQEVQALKAFVEKKQQNPKEAALPDLNGISRFIRSQVKQGQTANIFALIDLLRVSMADPRVSGCLVEESNSASVIIDIISSVCDWGDAAAASTRLVSVQLACNAFSTPLASRRLASDAEFREVFLRICTWLLLDESRLETRLAAADLAQNMVSTAFRAKVDTKPMETEMPDDAQVEIAACLLEVAQRESDVEVRRRCVLALGMLAYCATQDGELRELCSSMGAADILRPKGYPSSIDDRVGEEIAEMLE